MQRDGRGSTSAIVQDKTGVRVLRDEVEDRSKMRTITANDVYQGFGCKVRPLLSPKTPNLNIEVTL